MQHATAHGVAASWFGWLVRLLLEHPLLCHPYPLVAIMPHCEFLLDLDQHCQLNTWATHRQFGRHTDNLGGTQTIWAAHRLFGQHTDNLLLHKVAAQVVCGALARLAGSCYCWVLFAAALMA